MWGHGHCVCVQGVGDICVCGTGRVCRHGLASHPGCGSGAGHVCAAGYSRGRRMQQARDQGQQQEGNARENEEAED